MNAKEIYDLIREKPYKDGEKMIKDYARQEIKKRDEQWKLLFLGVIKLLPEPEFE